MSVCESMHAGSVIVAQWWILNSIPDEGAIITHQLTHIEIVKVIQ